MVLEFRSRDILRSSLSIYMFPIFIMFFGYLYVSVCKYKIGSWTQFLIVETLGTISDLIAHLLANKIQMNAKLPKHVIVVPFGLLHQGYGKTIGSPFA